ncbi:tetratricopeptide repeat protein [Streptomyces sp. WAC06614]|uniref:tetratricopeptide repeat protein n=1 Tax=Streptomyces sp. WAC06614 TaxID=2487416 RepID=UPI000F7A3B50|nr:tetratricopeptide repeat protein [Streptomyces sp. WAC06614]RSS82239.1 tetratricopeptide repeat protein [Streptomyces sp. WAC06614]
MTDDENGTGTAPHDGPGAGQDPIAWFKGLLRAHVQERGGGSVRVLTEAAAAAGLPLARSTIGDALSGPHAPGRATVLTLVTVLHRRAGLPGGPDLSTWVRRHEHMEDLLSAARTGTRSAADARASVQGRTWPRRFGILPEPAKAFLPRPPVRVPPGPGRFLLTGDGGVGKTQTAAEYVRARLADGTLDLVVWVSASSREAVVAGLAEAAEDLTGTVGQDAEGTAARLERWLAKAGRTWCVVVDGLDAPEDLDGLWPPSSPGVTLVTTRRRDAALQARGTVVDLAPFDPAESLAYLTARLGAQAGPPADLAALAADLGHLPLALAQVAAFLLDNGLTVACYRERLAREGSRLANLVPRAPGTVPDGYPLPLSAVWSLSVERADALRPAGVAGPVMHVLSLLDGTGVPGELLATPALAALAPHVSGAEARDEVHDALHNLRRLSLVTLDAAADRRPPRTGTTTGATTGPDTGGTAGPGEPGFADPLAGTSVRIHTLPQRATRDRLDAQERRAAVTAAAQALVEGWQSPGLPARLDRALRANALVLTGYAQEDLLSPVPHPVLYRTGHSLGESGQAAAALRHFRRLKEAVDARFAPDDEISLDTRGHLAWWQAKSGDAAGAARSFASLYEDQALRYPPEHPQLLQTRQSAAVWRGAAGDPQAAAVELRELYALRVRVLGADHRDTLSNRNHLANFLSASGDHEGALELHEQAWREAEARHGPGHRDVLRARAAAMRHRGELGDVPAVLGALRDLLEVQQEDDPDSPDTFATRAGIAEWTARAGDPAAAVRLLEPLLADRLRVMGPEHPHTLGTRIDLARRRTAAGDGARAATELTALIADQREYLGPDHPSLAVSRAALAEAERGA